MDVQPSPEMHPIRIGFSEAHGMVEELCQFPPANVEYSVLQPLPRPRVPLIRSPLNRFLRRYQANHVDVIEAVFTPVRTTDRWIYSICHFAEACAFNIARVPIPRSIRVEYIKRLILKRNFKKLIFWSKAAHDTLSSYGGIEAGALEGKDTIVYPAVRRIDDDRVRFSTGDLRLFFSGDFFRKGGVHVIDAFERAHKRYPGLSLTICCDPAIDFKTNEALRAEYLRKINTLPGIVNRGRISRQQLMTDVYPETDIFLMPTYVETFGMAILEAMAFGIPVISTNHFAIPEIVEDGVSGILIDTTMIDSNRLFKGYVVRDIPKGFREYMTEAVFTQLCRLVESVELRKSIGLGGLQAARTKFSFERRNAAVLEIYGQAVSD